MPDLRFQRRSDLILALQKMSACQFCTGNGVMCDKAAVAGQVLHESLQLRQHFLFTERGEFSAFRFNRQRRSGEQHQSAVARHYRMTLVRLTTRQATKSDLSWVNCLRISKVKRVTET